MLYLLIGFISGVVFTIAVAFIHEWLTAGTRDKKFEACLIASCLPISCAEKPQEPMIFHVLKAADYANRILKQAGLRQT